MHHAVRTLALLAALVLALAADPARALSISGIVVAPAGANTADVLVDNGAPRNEVASSVGLVGSAPGPVADVSGASVSFGTRYAWLVAADREAGGGTTSVDATASYTITFTVDNPLGLLYRIDVDTSRFGTLAIVDDGSGGASLTLGAVTGLLDGVSDAALGLGAQTFAATGSQAVSQTGATSSLVESATSRTYTLAFSWTATATSERDEAALLLGLAGALSMHQRGRLRRGPVRRRSLRERGRHDPAGARALHPDARRRRPRGARPRRSPPPRPPARLTRPSAPRPSGCGAGSRTVASTGAAARRSQRVLARACAAPRPRRPCEA